MSTIFVSPQGGKRFHQGRELNTVPLDEAVHRLPSGSEVVLLPGVYTNPVVLRGVKGTAKAPVTIRGESGVTLDGDRRHVRPPGLPEQHHYAFLKVIDCSHVVVHDLAFVDVWPTAIYLEDSHDVALQRISFNGATYAIYACGRKTQRLVIAHCSWIQEEEIWDQVLWKDIHHFPLPRRELDGDFFRSLDIPGKVVFYKNLISHAFNGIHFFASRDDRPEPVNSDVWIIKNTFMFIRDNAIESEFHARNWWVLQNRIYNCHKWFAFERCAGGYWYVFANKGWFDRKPGPPLDEFNGGAVIKGNNISDQQEATQLPSHPVYYFHNSWYLRSAYMKKGKFRNFTHFNNAIQYANAGDHSPGVVVQGREMVGSKFTDEWKRLEIDFHDDVCDHRDYPWKLASIYEGRIAGRHANPLFLDPREGQFAPRACSPLIRSGCAAKLELPARREEWKIPAGRNVGAVKEYDEGSQSDVLHDPYELNCPGDVLPRIEETGPWPALTRVQFPA